MCTVCGCSAGEVKIEGDGHSHTHVHADGTVHTHSHDHDHEHAHAHPHEPGHEHGHAHDHGHPHDHDHHHGQDLDFGAGPARAHVPGMSQARMVQIEQDILSKNNAYADANRGWFDEHGVFTLNLVSSPGSGKTTLLVKTIEQLKGEVEIAVVEGDQHADRWVMTGTHRGALFGIPATGRTSCFR